VVTGAVTISDTQQAKSHTRVDVAGLFSLLLVLAVVGTLALDAYAFSTLKL
jgi:hypothetical protein